MYITYSKKFKKQYNKLPNKIKEQFNLKIKIFVFNKKLPILNDHALQGKLNGLRSINISGDIRSIYEELPSSFHFIEIGSHSDLYN